MARTTTTAPLRRIVREFTETIENGDGCRAQLPREKLECGHVVAVRQDIYGPTNAYRRRCRRCGDQAGQS